VRATVTVSFLLLGLAAIGVGTASAQSGIHVNKATYGVVGGVSCDATERLRQQCNGKERCQVYVDPRGLCPDPAYGQWKSAIVNYSCDGKTETLSFPDTAQLVLECAIRPGSTPSQATPNPASSRRDEGRTPRCGVFEESHGRVTVLAEGEQFSLSQLIAENRFSGSGPAAFGCWVEIGTSDDLRGTLVYGYRVTDPSGERKEFGPSGIEAGGFGSTGGIPVPAYKQPIGAWTVEFFTIRRDNGARAPLGSVSFNMTGVTTGRVLPPTTTSTPQPASATILFEDSFRRPDSLSVGPDWNEYTLRDNVLRQEDSPWLVSGNTLRYGATGRGVYWEDFIETAATFPSDNVRVEFELRGQAATSRGYVGPSAFWSGDGRDRTTAQNVTGGPKHLGVAAWYRWENQGTRGVIVTVDGSANTHPNAAFAGVNQPDFARHVLTIRDGMLTYEAPGFAPVSYPVPASARSEFRHFTFGVRLYDAGVAQTVEIRNLRITALRAGAVTTTTTAAPQRTGAVARGIQTGPSVPLLDGAVPPSGGRLTVRKPGDPLDGMTIEVPAGSYGGSTTFAASYQPITSHTLGRNVTPISPLITIENGGAYAGSLMRVRIPVTVPAGSFAMGFFYDRNTGRLEGMPLVGIEARAITVATRHFSSFLISMMPLVELDQAIVGGTIDTGFRPGLDDWEFTNRGSYLEPGGHCAGQSLTALWYFVNRPDGPGVHLWNRYDRNRAAPATPDVWADDSQAYRLASVVHHDINWDSWENRLMTDLAGLSDQMTLRAFAYAMAVTGEPQEAGIFSSKGGGHDMIAYLVKGGTLYIADPNYPGDNNRRIVFDHAAGRFEPYNSGGNAEEIAAGYGKAYETIQYAAKTATVDWAQIGAHWNEMLAGTVGAGLFPEYRLFWTDERGQKTPLVDGASIELTYVSVALEVGAPGKRWSATLYLNGSRAEKSVNDLFELRPGTNEIGVAIYGYPPGRADRKYVDFKYVKVNSGPGVPIVVAPPPKAEPNPCAGITVAGVRKGGQEGIGTIRFIACVIRFANPIDSYTDAQIQAILAK